MDKRERRVLRGSIARWKDIIVNLEGIYRGGYIRLDSF